MSSPLLGVEPRHWASLLAVADGGSFKAAAERRGHAGSAIRHHLAQLERSAGVELLVRDGRAVALTEAGAALAEHARGIVGQLDAMAADLRGLSGGAPAPLRVATADHGAARVLAGALAALGDGPAVVVAEAGDAVAHREAVAHGALDAAVGEPPPGAGERFTVSDILSDPYVLVVDPRQADRHADGVVGPRDLSALTLVADARSPAVDLLRARVRAAGFEPPAVLHVDPGVDVQVAVGATEGGAALSPSSAVEDDREATLVLGLGDLLPARTLSVFWLRQRRDQAALVALADALRGAAREAVV